MKMVRLTNCCSVTRLMFLEVFEAFELALKVVQTIDDAETLTFVRAAATTAAAAMTTDGDDDELCLSRHSQRSLMMMLFCSTTDSCHFDANDVLHHRSSLLEFCSVKVITE